MFDTILEVIHGSPRIVGDNVITAVDPMALTEFSLGDNPTMKYGVGLLTPLMFMCLTLVLWTLFNCVNCCADLRCFKNSALVPPMIVFSCAFVATLAVGTVGLSLVTTGADSMFEIIGRIINLVDTVLDRGTAVVDHADSANLLLQVASGVCDEGGTNGTDAFPDVSSEIGELRTLIQDLDDSVEPIKTTVEDFEELTKGYINTAESSIIALTIILYLFIAFYVVSSVVRTYKPEWNVNRYFNATVGVVVNTLGILAVFIMAIAISFIAVIALAGSDVCVPGVDTVANQLIASVAEVDYSSYCSTSPYDLICYYQTCDGGDPLGSIFSDIERLQIDFQDQIQGVIDSVPGELPNRESCVAQLGAVKNKFGEIGPELDVIRTSLSCTTLNRIYRDLVDTAVCEEVFTGLAVMYVFIYTSVIMFLVALILQSLLDFKVQSYEELGKVTPSDENDNEF